MLFTPTYKKNSSLIEITHINWGPNFGGRGFTTNSHHRYVLGKDTWAINNALFFHDSIVLGSDDAHLDAPEDIKDLFKHIRNTNGVGHSEYRVNQTGLHGFYAYIDSKQPVTEGIAMESLEQSLGLFVISRFPQATGIHIATEYGLSRTFLAKDTHLLAA